MTQREKIKEILLTPCKTSKAFLVGFIDEEQLDQIITASIDILGGADIEKILDETASKLGKDKPNRVYAKAIKAELLLKLGE